VTRARIFSSVVFPAPLGPMTPRMVPRSSANETSFSAQISFAGFDAAGFRNYAAICCHGDGGLLVR